MIKSTRLVYITFLLIISAVFSLFANGCRSCGKEVDDEALILELIKRGASLAEQKKIKELMELTVKDFRESGRNMDRRSVRMTLMFAFKRYGKFKVLYPRPNIKVQDSKTEATARIPFIISRQGQEAPDLADLYEDPEEWISYVSNKADPYYLNLQLVKQGDDWMVHSAHLTGMRGLNRL